MADWRFEEGRGQTVRDSSSNDNDGVLGATSSADSGDPSWFGTSSFRPPFWRYGLRFRGDDYVTVRDSPSLEPTRVSVSVALRASASPGSYRYVVSKGALECLAASYGVYTGRDGGLIFYISNGTQYALSPDAGAAVWDGDWHTVVGSYDGTSVRLTVDGKQAGPATVADVPLAYGLDTTDNLYIGDYHGTCVDSTGFVGDVASLSITTGLERRVSTTARG